eukprot:s2586_g1.t1
MAVKMTEGYRRSPDIPELRKRMSVHFQQKLGLYHERVQRWIGELIAKEKDGFSKLLSQRELPFDPDCIRLKIEAVRYVHKRTTNYNSGETRVQILKIYRCA